MIAPRLPSERCWIGCDVGSTAVKAVGLDAGNLRILTSDYLRHGTRQAEGTLQLLKQIELRCPGLLGRSTVFFTGSGGRPLAERAGCRFTQEVNAVALATERLYPQAGSIVDLGGQDAKIIIWMGNPGNGSRRKFFSMNDKCAGGTGSVIDRIVSKLGLSSDDLSNLRTDGLPIHPVAARCGVFAETDINSLQKQGIPREELLGSLFEAIVQQNLSVLTRGATLLPPVLLLGGPHAFLPGLVDAWRRALTSLWRERGILPPAGVAPPQHVQVPENACYFAAIGAVLYGIMDGEQQERAYPSGDEVLALLESSLKSVAAKAGEPGLLDSPRQREEVRTLARQAKPVGFPAAGSGTRRKTAKAPARRRGDLGSLENMDVVIGLDAGSTSTKAVILDLEGEVLAKAYRLSKGDPLADARIVLSDLEDQALGDGWRLRVRGLGVTGYAKDMLGEFLGADLVLVETVAHARSGLRIDPHVQVIVDVGGQDIKVLVLRDGRVRDFRLNSQCSAGNGFFLQNTAQRFGIPLEEFADHAFRAQRCPRFHVGCAVFLESDIVNFQQIGWQPEEILAGLVRVLPRNIWLYVVGEPNLERLGRRYILQGGTQRNEAAVKAQVDFIRKRVSAAEILVHPHAGESGAIGVGLELLERSIEKPSAFLGFQDLRALRVQSRQDESTRCRLCPNQCMRTILEACLPSGEIRRYIVASCEAGRAAPGQKPVRAAASHSSAPDFSARAGREAFDRRERVAVGHAMTQRGIDWLRWVPDMLGTAAARKRRAHVRIGFPRALNLYQAAPFFMAYLQGLGVSASQIQVSGVTTERLFRRGIRRGAIDNCYPSKLALAHVHDLLERDEPPDWIFFPILINLPQEIDGAIDVAGCPSSQAAPEVVKAALTREGDRFAARGVRYLNPVLNLAEPALLERQMLEFWGALLGVTRGENRRAIQAAGEVCKRDIEVRLRAPALKEIQRLERDRRAGIVVLGRPYHDDPGLNHHIFQDLNRLGYAIFSIASLPRDRRFLGLLFSEDIALGRIRSPFDISDVWRHSFSANSNAKLWAAKVVARHPNLIALDISSFRCGHDAPIYATVEAILEASRTPYFAFHEIDENRPSGAIRLRVETIDYFLREYEIRRLGRDGRRTEHLEQEHLQDLLDHVPV